jgi:outer membrane protein insertion porin family
VPGTADQVDLTMTVKEKPTGNIMLGAGFSSADKIALTASVKQDNVFGSGNYIGLEINTSKSTFTIAATVGEPYYTVDGISRSWDVYYRENKPLNSQGESYKLVTPGGSVRFGIPFSDIDTVFFGI